MHPYRTNTISDYYETYTIEQPGSIAYKQFEEKISKQKTNQDKIKLNFNVLLNQPKITLNQNN